MTTTAVARDKRFATNNTPNDVKVKIAIIHLEGKALHWHTTFVRTASSLPIHNWVEYIKLLIDQFDEECDDHMVDLMTLC